MNDLVRLLFHEVADLGPVERDKVFTTRNVAPEVRAEIESLLSFDSSEEDGLSGCVAHAAQDALRSHQPPGPAQCGPYRLLHLLGSGGMGSVYFAERADGEIHQKVAIKLLRYGADRPSWHERFLRERQVLAYLNHPSVARLLDAGRTADGQPYLVMEYVEGVPIDVYAAGKELREQLALFLRVCEGVAHAHSHLIIHRDLKPSNILVDSSGQPKLLDFGIAKLLDETAEQTQTVERLLTPAYASPEQLRGTVQTTATDVYSLGAVLYKLLTGRPPNESDQHGSQSLDAAYGKREIPPARRLNPDVPADVNSILRKALRAEPAERYISVEALANDIRAFLESRPVEARIGNAWYHTRKFLRRNWVPAAAAALVIASLAAGLYVANSERVLAERRFTQLRQLSKKIFDLDNAIRDLPGSVPARESLVSASLEYLQGLAFDPAKDPDLARDVGEAYWRVGHIQGVPTDLNLGQSAQAEVNLKKAEALMDVVVATHPKDPDALTHSAWIASDRMILAESDHRRADAIAHARKAAQRLDQFLQGRNLKSSDIQQCLGTYGNISLAYINMHMYSEAVPFARRVLELSSRLPSSGARISQGLSLLANALRFEGDLDGSLQAIQRAREFAEKTAYPDATERMIDLYGVVLREGLILGEDGGVNLNRPAEAVAAFQDALDLTEQAARRDPNDSTSRGRVGTSSRELGNILRHSDPRRALAAYDLGIRRLGELSGNLKARRDRALMLADSSYALRALGRRRDATQRIHDAMEILKQTHDYPAGRVALDSEVYVILRARADDYAAQGDTARARQTYEQLLDQVRASQSDPLNDLRDAPRLSRLYEGLAAVYRQSGDTKEAASMQAQRQELWQRWNQKLPNNEFVLRQLSERSN